jgi:hypothetical protein
MHLRTSSAVTYPAWRMLFARASTSSGSERSMYSASASRSDQSVRTAKVVQRRSCAIELRLGTAAVAVAQCTCLEEQDTRLHNVANVVHAGQQAFLLHHTYVGHSWDSYVHELLEANATSHCSVRGCCTGTSR